MTQPRNTAPLPETILHVRPSDPTRTAIVEYANHFRRALERVGNATVIDFPPTDLIERIDTEADRDTVVKRVDQLAVSYERLGDRLAIHVEVGNALHREFWATVRLQRHLPQARFFCTVHDPPTLTSNPYRSVPTEFADKTPWRLLNVALTKGAETAVDLLKDRAERRFVRQCDALISLSAAGLESLRAEPLFRGKPLFRLPHVFAPDQPVSAPAASETTIAFFSFLAPNKGIETLLEAFDILSNQLKKEASAKRPRLLIFGGVSNAPGVEAYLNSIRERVARSTHAERIDFAPGFVEKSERDRKLAEADILALPFPSAGRVRFSSAGAVRALGLGKAIVAAQSNTLEEVIVDGQTGLTCPEDDATSLAESLRRLTLDPTLRRRLGANARRYIESEHSPERVAIEIEKVYRETSASD